MPEKCPACDGTGRDAFFIGDSPFTGSTTCDTCNGTGEVED